jgi:hypothetical protein
LKKYYDEQGQVQTVAVYRYYCRNRGCDKGSFTHLPPGLTPYSPYRTETKLLAFQLYGWSYSTYRRTAQALGVASITVYRWVSAWGDELLPVAALFGIVKSSGVVGVDEKYVLVPKNDKPSGPMRRWMDIYLAVDVYRYDLLHIAIYAHNDQQNAQAFLLALRAKGYQPRVIVADLRRAIVQTSPRPFRPRSITKASSTPCRTSLKPAASSMAAISLGPTPKSKPAARPLSAFFRPKPSAPPGSVLTASWPNDPASSKLNPKPPYAGITCSISTT